MASMIDGLIQERIEFLKEQLGAEDDPAYIRTFQFQIRILQAAQLDRLDELIGNRQRDLKESKDVRETDRIYAELEALEWLQRQAKHAA
jgi:hypothetical protein